MKRRAGRGALLALAAFWASMAVVFFTKEDLWLGIASLLGAGVCTFLADLLGEPASQVLPSLDLDGPSWHSDIDDAAAHIKEGRPEITIQLLERLLVRGADSLKPWERFRIYAKLGSANLSMNKPIEAAALFRKAHAQRPDNPEAMAYRGLAAFLEGNLDEAYSLASDVASDTPDVTLSHVVRVRASPPDTSFQEVLDSIPKLVASKPEVRLALFERASKEGLLGEAEQVLREFPQSLGESADLQFHLAELIVETEQRLLEQTPQGPIVSSPSRLQEAIGLLSDAVEQLPSNYTGILLTRSYLLRGISYRLLGETSLALKDLRQAHHLDESDPVPLVHLVALLATQDEIGTSDIELLESFVEKSDAQEVSILLAEVLLNRNSGEDLHQALALLRRVLSNLDKLPQEEARSAAVRLVIEVAGRLQEPGLAVEAIDSIQAGLSVGNKAVLRGEALARAGREPEAELELEQADLLEAEASVEALGSLVRRRHAILLEALGHHKAAFQRWRELVRLDRISDETSHLLNCAQLIGADDFILNCCEQLRQADLLDDRTVYPELRALVKYSEFSKARSLLEEYLERYPDDAVARVNLVALGLQLGWGQTVDENVALLPGLEEVPNPEIGAQVVRVLGTVGSKGKAADYAYELFRRFPDNAHAHQALIMTMLLNRPEPQKVLCVDGGVAVAYREVDSTDIRWLIVEDGKDPDPSRGEYPLSHSLVQAMQGKKVGEQFVLHHGGLGEILFEIVELRDKRSHRANELMDSWPQRFPDNPAFVRFSIEAADDSSQIDISQIEEAARRLSEWPNHVEQLFSEGNLPISTLARALDKTVIESLRYVASSRHLSVRATRGTASERSAIRPLLDATDCVVIDPTVLGTLELLDEVHLLSLLPCEVVVTEGALQELRHLGSEIGPETQGYMGFTGGLWVTEVDQDEARGTRKRHRDVLQWVEENLTVVGGSEAASIDVALREELEQVVAPTSLEAVATAINRGCPLWTDDGLLVEMLRNKLEIDQVWSDVIFDWLAGRGVVSKQKRGRLVANLLRHGYALTSLNAALIVDVCELALWSPSDPDLAAVLAEFGNTEWERESAHLVVEQTLGEVWRQAPTPEHAGVVTARLLLNMGHRSDLPQLIRRLIASAPELLGMATVREPALRRHLHGLLNGRLVL